MIGFIEQFSPTFQGQNLIGFTEDDVKVRVGTGYCNVTSIPPGGNSLLCKPPRSQPPSLQGSKYPEVIVQVGRNFTKLVGYLKYETESLPLPIIIGIGGGVLLLVVIFFVILCVVKRREQMTIQKKWQIQMDNLEGKVAKECKEGVYLKDIRCVSVISVITDKRLGATKPSIRPINHKQAEAEYGNLTLAYLSDP